MVRAEDFGRVTSDQSYKTFGSMTTIYKKYPVLRAQVAV